jgi:hypothetical protein
MEKLSMSLGFGALSGAGATVVYAISAVVLAILDVISTLLRTCRMPYGCHPGVVVFGFVTEIGVALLTSVTVFGFPMIALTLASSLILGGIEIATGSRLSNRIVALYSLGVTVLITVVFQLVIAARIATKGLGEYYGFGLPWEEFASFWQGLPMVLYVAVGIGLGWLIHKYSRRQMERLAAEPGP